MPVKRTDRLNSLLKEVISEVIHRQIHHVQFINESVTITRVDITNDLYYAKVYVSLIGTDKVKKQTVDTLQDHAKQIAFMASKNVRMRHFPSLTFELDLGLEKQLRIEELLAEASKERKSRSTNDEPTP